jgi:hypothetical protein
VFGDAGENTCIGSSIIFVDLGETIASAPNFFSAVFRSLTSQPSNLKTPVSAAKSMH